MTQELAKLLRDAGFPQHENGKDDPYVPSLSELVAACDKCFWSLRRTPDGKWLASGKLPMKDSQIPYYETTPYETPDIAVAELYISMKLHEKENAKPKGKEGAKKKVPAA